MQPQARTKPAQNPAQTPSKAPSASTSENASAQKQSGRPPRPVLAAHAHSAALSIEEGRFAVEGGDSVAVAFLAMPCIRDHQASILEQRLRGMAESAGGRLAVSMTEVEDITSAGINALLVVHTHCRNLGGHLAIFGLTRELRRLFKITHLDRTIPLADTAQSAVQTFEPSQRRRWNFRSRTASRDAA